MLSKIHDDCLKNVTTRVLTRFSADLASWPSFWPQVTQFQTWPRNHQDKHFEQDSRRLLKQVTPMLPSKFGVNWPFGSGEEAKNRFSRWRSSWISDRHDLSYFKSTSHPDAPYQVSSQLAQRCRRSRLLKLLLTPHDGQRTTDDGHWLTTTAHHELKIHWCLLKLSSGNEKWTDGQMDRHTHVQHETIIPRHYIFGGWGGGV